MPWLATTPEMQRLEFITALASEDEPFKRVCERFEVSRETGYKWKRRFETEGAPGLRVAARGPAPDPARLRGSGSVGSILHSSCRGSASRWVANFHWRYRSS